MIASPYLRPFLRDGDLVVDDGLSGAVHDLPTLEAATLRALWSPESAADHLGALARDADDDALVEAMTALLDKQLVFESSAAAAEAFTVAMSRGLERVPFVDQVEVTNICPMRCGFCPRGVPGAMSRPTGRMDLGLYRALLDQLHPAQASYRHFELHHLGESLVHPQLEEFVREASARGLPTELSVNPALLTPERGRALVDAGLRRLVVSLDGIDDPTLIAIRGAAARYTRAEPNLDALLTYLRDVDDPPQVVIQMIDLHRNRHQHEAFINRWGTTGLPTVTAYVKDLDGDDPDTGAPSSRPLSFLCSYPWRSVVVLWDGRVVPCCRDDDARLVLGDLRESTLEQIWNGPAATELRERLAGSGLPGSHLCAGCPWRPDAFVAAAPSRHPDHARPHPLQW